MTMMERRSVTRRPVLMIGVIIFSEIVPRIQCKVTDISETGAGLEISTAVDIPQEFDLVVLGGFHSVSEWVSGLITDAGEIISPRHCGNCANCANPPQPNVQPFINAGGDVVRLGIKQSA